MGEVELAGVYSDVVIPLLQVSPHDLWYVEAHGRVLKRGTFEVDVVIVRGFGSRSQYCQYGECVQHLDGLFWHTFP